MRPPIPFRSDPDNGILWSWMMGEEISFDEIERIHV